ncbi:MAG: hypothetical protein WDM76_17510 [Limisphaerales bacterium]
MNRAAVLHALVVTAPDDFSVEHQHGTDGDSARRQTFLCLLDCCLKKYIHVTFLIGKLNQIQFFP